MQRAIQPYTRWLACRVDGLRRHAGRSGGYKGLKEAGVPPAGYVCLDGVVSCNEKIPKLFFSREIASERGKKEHAWIMASSMGDRHIHTYQHALDVLGYKGVCSSYDFRTTYATGLCEAGLTSKQVADKMGHSDTRMVDRIYARTRHESVMIHVEVLDKLNSEMLFVTENVTQNPPQILAI